MVQAMLQNNGVAIKTGNGVQSIKIEKNKKLKVITANDEFLADIVIVSLGATPNSELVKSTGMELTSRGAIRVNARMETSIKGIYAGSDVVETYHAITGQPVYFAIGTLAHKHGRVIAENICGIESTYPGTIFTQSVKLFDAVIARTGMRPDEASNAGFDQGTIDIEADDHKKHFPPSYKLRIRFTADKCSRRILGCQIVGNIHAEVSKRIDIVAVAIHGGKTVDDFIQMDLSYTPPLDSPWDATQMAAQAWRKVFVEKKS
jgi:NADPH-dependent 2,4-dienoyl-CoA reductase/sulfur reductase-like enzyme